MTAIWDIEVFKDQDGVAEISVEVDGDIETQYIFDLPAAPEDPDDDESDEKGGGVNKFGLMIKSEGLDEITANITWTDVTIHVYDLDLFNEFVEEVTEITGATPFNVDGKVVEVS